MCLSVFFHVHLRMQRTKGRRFPSPSQKMICKTAAPNLQDCLQRSSNAEHILPHKENLLTYQQTALHCLQLWGFSEDFDRLCQLLKPSDPEPLYNIVDGG